MKVGATAQGVQVVLDEVAKARVMFASYPHQVAVVHHQARTVQVTLQREHRRHPSHHATAHHGVLLDDRSTAGGSQLGGAVLGQEEMITSRFEAVFPENYPLRRVEWSMMQPTGFDNALRSDLVREIEADMRSTAQNEGDRAEEQQPHRHSPVALAPTPSGGVALHSFTKDLLKYVRWWYSLELDNRACDSTTSSPASNNTPASTPPGGGPGSQKTQAELFLRGAGGEQRGRRGSPQPSKSKTGRKCGAIFLPNGSVCVFGVKKANVLATSSKQKNAVAPRRSASSGRAGTTTHVPQSKPTDRAAQRGRPGFPNDPSHQRSSSSGRSAARHPSSSNEPSATPETAKHCFMVVREGAKCSPSHPSHSPSSQLASIAGVAVPPGGMDDDGASSTGGGSFMGIVSDSSVGHVSRHLRSCTSVEATLRTPLVLHGRAPFDSSMTTTIDPFGVTHRDHTIPSTTSPLPSFFHGGLFQRRTLRDIQLCGSDEVAALRYNALLCAEEHTTNSAEAAKLIMAAAVLFEPLRNAHPAAAQSVFAPQLQLIAKGLMKLGQPVWAGVVLCAVVLPTLMGTAEGPRGGGVPVTKLNKPQGIQHVVESLHWSLHGCVQLVEYLFDVTGDIVRALEARTVASALACNVHGKAYKSSIASASSLFGSEISLTSPTSQPEIRGGRGTAPWSTSHTHGRGHHLDQEHRKPSSSYDEVDDDTEAGRATKVRFARVDECVICCQPIHSGNGESQNPDDECDGGVVVQCWRCGHGGHAEHLAAWFRNHTECPAGCGCECIF